MRSNGKRLGAMLLALVMVFSLLPTAAFAVRLDEEIAIDAPDTAADAVPAGTLDAGDSAELMEAVTAPTAPDGYAIYTPKASELSVNCVQGGGYDVDKMVDGEASTFWTSAWSTTQDGGVASGTIPTEYSHNYIRVSLSAAKRIKGFYYLPRPNTSAGTFTSWEIHTSSDNGATWAKAAASGAEGTWSLTQNTTSAWQYAELTNVVETQYIALIPTNMIQNKVGSCAEIRLVVEASDFVSEADDNPFVTDGSDASEDMTLTADMLSANSVRTGSTLDKLLDNGNTGDSQSWQVAWADSNAASGTSNPVVGDTYIQVNLGDTAKSVQGFRYQPKADGNGSFNSWEIWGYNGDATGEALTAIAAKTMTDFMSAEGVTKLGEGTWTIQGNDSTWHLAKTTTPTDVKLVRLRAVTAYKTSNPAGLKNTTDNFDSISCGELRLVGYRGGSITNNREFTITVTKGSDNSAMAASVTIGENTQTADSNTGVATFTGMSNIPYTATVSMSGYKTRTVEVSADDTNVDVTLWQSVASNADVTAHKWDYPLWAASTDNGESASPRFTLNGNIVHGGTVDAFSYSNHKTNKFDLPAWAAIDGKTETHWHDLYNRGTAAADSNHGDANTLTGYKDYIDTNGKWYEFTLEQPTKIIGLWYMRRSTNSGNPGAVKVKVSEEENTPSDEEWLALPAVGSGNMTASDQSWVFVELPAPVQAKHVRFYSTSTSNVAAAELRVVMDPETSGAKHLTGTVQTTAEGNAAIPGVTLTVANHSATSGDDGAFDLGYLPAGIYSVTASAPGYASKTQDVTISDTDTDTAKTVTIQLDSQTLTLSGTVSDASSDTPVEGARLTLLSHNDARNHTPGVDVGVSNNDGSYSMSVTPFGQGAAYLLVTHPNYTTVCEEVTISAENGGVTTKDITLTASAPYKVYTFDNGSDVADEFVPLSSGGSTATAVLENGALKYTMVSGSDQAKNTIVNKSFVMKSGTVEFDVTANQAMTANTLFGIVVRVPGGSENRVYVGLRSATNYGYQAFGTTPGSDSSKSAGTAGPAMANGVTRHIAVKVEDTGAKITITVDGKQVWDCNYDAIHTLPDAGYIGFSTNAQVNDTPSFLIDNLVIRRTDLQSAVTIGTLTDGTLSTKIVTGLDTTGTDLATGDNAYAGDTIKISATGIGDGKVLAVKVTKTGDANTVVTTTKQADGSFTFTMPAYPVTITPAAATELTTVTVSGANYGTESSKYARVGNTLTVTPATGVTYQWQYNNGTSWTNIAGATAASFQLTTGQYNSTNSANQVRVVVTGDDVTYAGTVESAAVDVQAALQEVTGVTFERSTIEMWSNVDNDPNTGNTAIEGKTTTVTAFIAPTTVTRPMTVEWTTSDSEVVSISNEATQASVQGEGDEARLVVTATLTALKPGTATIKCYATAKDGTTRVECTTGITVTVKAETKSVKVYKAEGNMGTTASTTEVTVDAPLVIYTNSDADLTTLNGQEGATQRYNKFRLFATPTPTEVSDVSTWQWVRQDQSLTGLIRSENTDHNNATRLVYAQGSAEDGYTEQNVGERTILVKKTGDDGPTYATFRVVVLRHLVHDVTVGYTEGATEARPGVTLEAVTSALKISDDGVEGLTYQWYRKGTSDSEPQAISSQTNKTYKLTDDDIGCEISVKVIATPKYGTNVDAAQRYYYEGERTSTNAITVGKNAAPDAPELSSTPYSNNAGTETKGTIVITSPVSGETYEYRKKTSAAGVTPETWGEWQNATLTGGNTIGDLDAGDYQVRIKENNLHDAGTAKAVTVQDSSKTYHNVSVTVTTQDFQGNESQTLTGGKAVLGSDKVEAGQSATLTVTPAAGFEILSVTNGSDTLTGTDGENGVKTYTVSNVTAPVAFAVTFKQKSVTISHTFTNLKCNLAGLSNNSHTVAYGSVTTIILSLADGVSSDAYGLPERADITMTMGGASFTNFGYAQDTGTISITGGVTDNVTITASAKAKSYAVSFTNMSNVSGPSGTQTATYGTNYEAQLTAVSGYSLPTEVTVKRGDTTLTLNTDYTYANGKVTVMGAAITGNITISATGVKITTPLTAVTITLPQGATAPTVGDTLRAAVTPEGASATYKWYVGGTEVNNLQDQSHQSYTVRADDVGKKIKVEATGTGDNSGKVTSTETAAVLARTYPVTGVTLNKQTTSIVFGGTETLTATVAPDNATNKKVTWGTSNANVATVDANGVVTAKGVGEATITVTTEDNSHQATCTVTVTAKDLTNDGTATVRVSGALELGKELSVTFVPADAATGARYTWSIVDANGNEVYAFTDNGATVTLPNDSSYLGAKVKVVVTYGGNYSGTKTRITDGTIAGEVPSHSVVIATGIQNGTVTADKTTAKQGETVTLTVTPAAGYELDALTVTGYHGEAVATTKVDDTHYTFDMPRNLQTGDAVNVTATFKLAPVAPTTYDVTVSSDIQNGTVTADKARAAGGETVTLTVAPAAGYELATLTVTDADGAAVTVAADNTFVMPAKNVTVTATFTVKTAEKDALREAVKAAKAAKEGVIATDKTADAVETGTLFVTTLTMTNFTKAIDAAEALLTKADATQDEVDDALATLNAWTTEYFPAAIQNGTMDDRALKSAIKAVRDLKASVFVIDGKNEDEVADGVKFVTTQEMAALSRAIKDAETALNAENKNQASLDAAIEPLDAARLVFTVAIKTGTGGESGYVPEVNTDALEAAIAEAEAAKKGVTISDKTPAEVNRGTKFVTHEVMDALDAAIETAKDELNNNENKTDGSVSNAVDALNAAVETFKAAVQTGTKSTGGSSSGNRPSTGTTTETKPDGTKVTTETKPDGTKVVTTESPDGSKEVVETKKDGTVTETKTDAEGAKTEKVTTPDKDVTITVTDKDGEELAKIELPAEIPAAETKFEDVPADHWAEESINKVAGLKLVNGTGDNKYSPVAPMTRGALATVLHRLSQGKTDYKATFRDVSNGQYYTEGVAWAAKAGVVKGITTELFAPEQSITREQLAVMMARYAKLIGLDTAADADTLDSFTDADQTGDWAVDGMAWCVKVGILQGKGDSILDPTASVSRAEVATMLDRFLAIVVK